MEVLLGIYLFFFAAFGFVILNQFIDDCRMSNSGGGETTVVAIFCIIGLALWPLVAVAGIGWYVYAWFTSK